jgi:hypothetical protein
MGAVGQGEPEAVFCNACEWYRVKVYFVIVAGLACATSIARLWIAWADYQRRWCKLPSNIAERKKK